MKKSIKASISPLWVSECTVLECHACKASCKSAVNVQAFQFFNYTLLKNACAVTQLNSKLECNAPFPFKATILSWASLKMAVPRSTGIYMWCCWRCKPTIQRTEIRTSHCIKRTHFQEKKHEWNCWVPLNWILGSDGNEFFPLYQNAC